MQEVISSINGLIEGTLRIGSYSSMLSAFVPRVIYNYSSAYSNITFNILEVEHGSFEKMLTNGEIDCGFMSEHTPKGFDFVPLFRDQAVLIMHNSHPFASFEEIDPAMLNGCDFIMPMLGYDDLINSIRKKVPFSPSVRYHPASDTCAISMVSANMGLTVISSLQTASLPGNVTAKRFNGDFGRNLGLTVKSLKHTAPAMKEFIRIAKETAAQINQEHLLVK